MILNKIDIIHADASSFSNKYLEFDKKIIIECEGVPRNELLHEPRIDKIIFQSKYAGRYHLKLKKSMLVYPAVPYYGNLHSKPNSRKFDLTILTVGFGSFIKGFDVAFCVFKRLKNKGIKVRLIIAGSMGHDFTNYPEVNPASFEKCRLIENEIQAYASENDDLLIGQKSKAQMLTEIYPQADVLLHPCRMETFGYTVLEALSFGIPVVSVNFKAIPEMIIHGKNGFLIDSFNWDGISRIDEDKMNSTEWFENSIEKSFEYIQNIHTLPSINIDRKFLFMERNNLLMNAYNAY